MIVPMKKITLLVAQQEVDEALFKLRKLGVVHIEHLNEPKGKEINVLKKELQNATLAFEALHRGATSLRKEETPDVKALIVKTVDLLQEKEQLLLKRDSLRAKISWFNEWGKISLASLQELTRYGLFIKLYIIERKHLKRLPNDKYIFVVKKEKSRAYIVFITFDNKESLGFDEVKFPQEDPLLVEEEFSNIEKRLKEIEERLNVLSRYRDVLKKYIFSLSKQLEFYTVRLSMAKEEGFWYLKGFIPEEEAHSLKQLAKKEGWAMLEEDPDNPEEVPTLIRNPRWVRIIEPVFKLMGTLPGYNEYDISIWFLLFLTVFFAILIGDAGYGMLFLMITFFLKRKLKNAPSEVFHLMYVFSIATIIWGVCSGTYFGAAQFARLPFLKTLIIERINSFVDANQQFMMYLCFLIGAIHLTVAHVIRAFRFHKSLIALSQLGWIAIIWGLFFVAGTLVVGRPFSNLGGYLLVTGVVFALAFSYPNKNVFKALGNALMEVPLKIVSSFGDVVSYLRLFAVGYATVVVAGSFNDIAASLGFGDVIKSFGSALILFFGHALNIALGFMAIVVHGVRLNMLEFSGHLGMEWSGKPYMPFKE